MNDNSSPTRPEGLHHHGLRAAKAVARDRGVSDVTLWRMGKRGWVRIVNVCGRAYVDLASLAEFDERARRGEFAKLASLSILAGCFRRNPRISSVFRGPNAKGLHYIF